MGIICLTACSKPDSTANESTLPETQSYTSTSEQMTTDIDVDNDLDLLNRSGTSGDGNL